MRIGPLALLLLLMLATPARAADWSEGELPRRGSGWDADELELQYRRGMGTALAGRLIVGTAPLLVVGGAFVLMQADDADSQTAGVLILLAGGVAGWTGPPLVAAGSLRARRALVRGGAPLPATAGALGWGLWATAIGASYALAITDSPAFSWVAGGALLCSVVAGQVQVGANRRAAERLGWSERRVAVALAPTPGGFALVGRF